MSTAEHAPPIAAPLGDVTTERLDLRRFDPGDINELADVFAHEEVWRIPYGRAFTRTEAETFLELQIREWNECGFGCWVAREISNERIVGYVGLLVADVPSRILPAVEVGWRFAPAAWARFFGGSRADIGCR